MKKQLNLFQVPDEATDQEHPVSGVPTVGDLGDMIFEECTNDPVKKSRTKKKLWDALQGQPKTMMQLSVEVHVMRSSICPIINSWRDQRLVFVTGREKCPITGHKADYYTANREIFLEIMANKADSGL